MSVVLGNEYPELEGTLECVRVEQLNAKPMTRLEYNNFREWGLPKDECGDDKGYIVQNEEGYISWIPEELFKKVCTFK